MRYLGRPGAGMHGAVRQVLRMLMDLMRLAREPEEGPFSIWGSWQCTQCNLAIADPTY